MGTSTREPALVRRVIAASWRRLTGGRSIRDPERRTLVACSGGADSSALLIVLAAAGAPGSVVAGHVVHDLRPHAESIADRDAARSLAGRLGVAFVEGRALVRGKRGNAESLARRERYAELERLAVQAGCRYVATAHHADDQLETVLMRLIRGAGPGGLAGLARKRRLAGGDPSVRVVRPMLESTHAEAEAICREAGWAWAVDHTNTDGSGLRSALRLGVLAALRQSHPSAARKGVEAAGLCRAAWGVVRGRASELVRLGTVENETVSWSRSVLRGFPPVVVSEAMRETLIGVSLGSARDRVSRRSLAAVVRAARDLSGEPRRFQWRGAEVLVDADQVLVRGHSVRGMSG